MAGDWSEDKHPRATDGKFGAGGGGATNPAAAKAARAKAAIAAKKAGAKAKALVSGARDKAKAVIAAAAAKRTAAMAKAKASGRKLTPAAKAKISSARTKAKEKAKAIVDKAKAKAAAMKSNGLTAKPKRAAGPSSDAELGGLVHAAIDKIPESAIEGSNATGRRAFISDAYDHMSKLDKARFGSLDQFKKKLVELNRDGHLTMERQDLVDLSPEVLSKSERSETSDASGSWHSIQVDPSKGRSDAEPRAPRQVSDRDLAKLRDATRASSSPEEKEAQKAYSRTTYIAVNGQLRSGADLSPEVAESVGRLDSMMSKNRTTSPIVTYRGGHTHQSYADLQVGEILHDKAYMSTSTDGRRAFPGEFLFVITSPAGTKAAAINSHTPSEKEILLGRGTTLRLDRREVTKNRGKTRHVLHFTVVGQH